MIISIYVIEDLLDGTSNFNVFCVRSHKFKTRDFGNNGSDIRYNTCFKEYASVVLVDNIIDIGDYIEVQEGKYKVFFNPRYVSRIICENEEMQHVQKSD